MQRSSLVLTVGCLMVVARSNCSRNIMVYIVLLHARRSAAEERVTDYVQHCQEELRESAEFYAAD